MARYAILNATLVENIAEWDGLAAWPVPQGRTRVGPIAAGVVVAPGYTTPDSGATFVFGQTADQIAAANHATLGANVANALVRLRAIKAQATTFASQAPYGTANLASLNDLLAKSQSIATAVGDISDDLLAIARILSNQFDATN